MPIRDSGTPSMEVESMQRVARSSGFECLSQSGRWVVRRYQLPRSEGVSEVELDRSIEEASRSRGRREASRDGRKCDKW